MTIRVFEKSDFPFVQEIYQQGIDTGNATFQEKAKSWLEWDTSMHPDCRLIAVINDQIAGWAAISPISTRKVYSGVAEVSVYIGATHQGLGIGQELLSHLIECSEKNNVWMLQASIFPENTASIALHEKNGFRILGTREKLGKMNGVWRDVILMERRSNKVGVS